MRAGKFPGQPESGTAANIESYGGTVAGVYVERGTAYAIDAQGNRQVFNVEAFGGDTEVLGGGLSLARQVTNAPNVYSLGGQSHSLGVSGGPYAYEGAVELNFGSNYRGVTVGGGASAGFIPGGARGIREHWTPVRFRIRGGGGI